MEEWKYGKQYGLNAKTLYFHASAQRGISTARGRTISTLKWKNPRSSPAVRGPFAFARTSTSSFANVSGFNFSFDFMEARMSAASTSCQKSRWYSFGDWRMRFVGKRYFLSGGFVHPSRVPRLTAESS